MRSTRRSTSTRSAQKGLFIGSGASSSIDDRACIVQFAPAGRAVLHARVVREVHALPRRHALAGQILRAVEEGTREEQDLDLLLDVCDRIIGKCLCVLGDSAAMPVASCVDEVPRRVPGPSRARRLPLRRDSQLAGLFAPVDQHAHTTVPQEAPV